MDCSIRPAFPARPAVPQPLFNMRAFHTATIDELVARVGTREACAARPDRDANRGTPSVEMPITDG
jgi:hypothetical protein